MSVSYLLFNYTDLVFAVVSSGLMILTVVGYQASLGFDVEFFAAPAAVADVAAFGGFELMRDS